MAVWRLVSTTDQYILLNGSITLIELQPVDTLAHIYCTQEILVNSIEVRRGDVIGVMLPTENPIPMIGMESENILHYSETLDDLFRLLNSALHLYAEISKLP